MVLLFNKTIKISFQTTFSHETVTCDERYPPQINDNIKQLTREKNDTYGSYISNDENPQMFHEVKYLQNQLKNLIERCQEKYYLCISKIIDGSDDKS